MGNIRRGALGTGAKLRQREDAIVSAPHTLTALRWLAFWNTHTISI